MRILNKMLGEEGDDRDARFLSRQGDKILERNYRTLNGEIDLIALHWGKAVFVEMETRMSDA